MVSAQHAHDGKGSSVEYIILPAEKKDVRPLNQLVNSAYRGKSSLQGWTSEANLLDGQRVDEKGLEDLVSAPGIVILCLRRTGSEEILGCVELRVLPEKKILLGMLTVRPDLQNQGLGSRLMTYAENFAKTQLGARKIAMKVISIREELVAYYERKSYVRKNEFEKFPYGDERFGIPRRHDLQFVLMEKTL